MYDWSMQMTLAPCDNRRSQRWEPRNPAPPVTSILSSRCIAHRLPRVSRFGNAFVPRSTRQPDMPPVCPAASCPQNRPSRVLKTASAAAAAPSFSTVAICIDESYTWEPPRRFHASLPNCNMGRFHRQGLHFPRVHPVATADGGRIGFQSQLGGCRGLFGTAASLEKVAGRGLTAFCPVRGDDHGDESFG